MNLFSHMPALLATISMEFLMKLTVLVDNNTLIDRYFEAEPGLSFLVEDEDRRLLFDTGYSDLFLKNAMRMGRSLSELDYLVLSHSHLDHTWGLDPLIRYYAELEMQRRPFRRPAVIAHPEIFHSVSAEGFAEFGTLFSEDKIGRHFSVQLSARPVHLTERLIFLGEIPRLNGFEGALTFGRKLGATEDDVVIEDSALVYQSTAGLIVITGCSHAGICNIVEYAKSVCGDDRVLDIVGGLHLQNPPDEQLAGTLDYLAKLGPRAVHACHCTDLQSKIALSHVVPVEEVGVGLRLHYDE